MPIDQSEFRRVMGHFASGVTVVTSLDGSGQPVGFTANAVSSVSLDPPLVLVCIDKRSESLSSFEGAGRFAINILAESQESLSRRFAKSGGDKYVGVGYRAGTTGVPLLDGTIAHVECRVAHAFPAGDHTIFVGEVVGLGVDGELDPLLYFRGGYRSLAR